MKQTLQKSGSANRDFGFVLASGTLSQFGDMLLLTVIALRIAAGDEPWHLTVVYIAFAVPLFALAPLAGRIVDDYDSRVVLVLAGLLQAGAAVGIAASGSFAALVGAIVLLQVGQAVSAPAWSALVPRIVGDQAVGRATGNLAAAGAIAGMAGAATGGFLYGPWGFHEVVLINAVVFALIAGAGVLVRTRRGRSYDRRLVGDAPDLTAGPPSAEHAPAGPEQTAPDYADPAQNPGEALASTDAVGRRATSGWGFIRADTVLSVLLPALWALVVAGEALNVAEVFLIRGTLGASATLYGICGAAFLIGSVVGPLLAGRVTDNHRRIRWCAITAALTGVLVIGMSVSPSAWIVAGLLVLAGALMSAFSAMVVAVMLLRTPDEVRGRVMATVNGTLRGFGVIALVLGGLMVQFLGARAAFAVVGILVIGAAVLIRRVMRWVPPEAASISESRPVSRPA